MAAGMGSRYGGLKQIDPIGPNGEVIIDYSIYDAKCAGFEDVICIIKHSIEEDFKAIMNRGAAKHMNIKYAFQDMEDIPEGFTIPEGREKPWGTGHAILAVRDMVDSPFLIINADDYYGSEVFKTMYNYLAEAKDGKKYNFCMAGYKVCNTITDKGTVTRGICKQRCGRLSEIRETAGIGYYEDFIGYPDPESKELVKLDPDTLVSMNMFGFTPAILKELKERFPKALESIIKEDPLKGEFFIPKVVGDLIAEGKAGVKVLPCTDQWQGVTYKEDKPVVAAAMKKKAADGSYPEKLWD